MVEVLPGTWTQLGTIGAKRFVCGHCGADVSPDKGYYTNVQTPQAQIYICHSCNRPTLIFRQEQVPAPRLGQDIQYLPKDIDDLYREIRDATAARAYTATVLAARKLLMHIAVEAGAEEGKTFLFYVDYLVDNHYTPPNSKGWVDKIRKLGNDANHEIVIMGQTEASDVIKFLEMILRFKYEFPSSVEDVDASDSASALGAAV